MFDSIKPTIGALPAKSPYRTRNGVKEVEPHSDEHPSKPKVWNRGERRKGGDRRLKKAKKGFNQDAKFEMRISSGRRNSDRHFPHIETKA